MLAKNVGPKFKIFEKGRRWQDDKKQDKELSDLIYNISIYYPQLTIKCSSKSSVLSFLSYS